MANDSPPIDSAPAKEPGLFSRKSLPAFAIFFMWGFGVGALWVVRPLFAYDLGGSNVFLVGLVSAASAAPRIIAGPITGYLADAWGRRPMIVIGAVGHGVILVGQFASQNYVQFLLLELAAGLAIGFWNVSSNVLVADITGVSNRGRGVAVRNISQRAGLLAGPAVGGLIGALFGLRYVFLFIAATKIVVLFITIFLLAETRPERPPRPAASAVREPREGIRWSMFKTRAFFALSTATLAYGMIGVGPGVFRTLFPVHAQANAGLGDAQIGSLLSITGLITLGVTMPIGVVLDVQGRKRLLFAGMVVTAVSAYLMAITSSFPIALVAVAVFGVAEGINTSAVQTYAMDLAPVDQRGRFLGVWHIAMNIGQFAGPLGIGLVAWLFGLTTGLLVMAGILAAAAAIVFLFATETRQRRARAVEASG